MVAKFSLKRLLYALLLFSILVCVHFLISFKRLPDILEKQPKAKLSKKNSSKTVAPEAEKVTTSPEQITSNYDKLPWYFKMGTRRPTRDTTSKKSKIWPEDKPAGDRITEQLMYVPAEYDEQETPFKKIVLWHGLDHWVKPGQNSFLEANCPVDRCLVTDDQLQASEADAILFKDHFVLPSFKKPPNQIWIMYLLECPHHTERLQYNDLINWTATYRRDSDIVTPYERWVYYDENIKQAPILKQNYAANKTHQVAWFVSNCNAKNGRLHYALELQKYIGVDIYGFCGRLRCPRTKECFHLLDTTYKFYLAFENSNCIDYITEKFFVNGLQHDILPIVMGARPEDYAAVAPYRSYIHVDNFASPKELAHYLLKLDNDDNLYNSYFRWKGTGEFINTQFFCRLCAMLHEPITLRSYRNLNKWWKNINTCIPSGSWKKRT